MCLDKFKNTNEKIWNMLRKTNGKNLSKSHQKQMTKNKEKKKKKKKKKKKGIADVLVETFQQSSSCANYKKSWQNVKINEQEKHTLNFNSDNNETYNIPFTIPELMESLQNAHDSATGTDEIRYQILNHLPNKSLNILLEIFNVIWKRGIFPKCWTEAIVIPVPKPKIILNQQITGLLH